MELIRELDHKLPELCDLQALYAKQKPETLPYFLRLIIAAILNPDGPSCAFVIPEPRLVSYLTAVFSALVDTQQHFSENRENFAINGLRIGERVMLLPSGEIYLYAGCPQYNFQTGNADGRRFRLGLLGENAGNGSISLALNEIHRLMPTEKKRPFGRGATLREIPPLSALDQVLNVQSYGNPSVFRNKIILHCSRQDLESFIEQWNICGKTGNTALENLDDLPWGMIDSEGELKGADRYQLYGEPILALAGRLTPIAIFCGEQPEKTHVVVTSAKGTAVESTYDVDQIIQRQKLILITDSLNLDEVKEIKERGVEIWKFTKQEIFVGQNLHDPSITPPVFSPLQKLYRTVLADLENIEVHLSNSEVFLSIEKNISRIKNGLLDPQIRECILSVLQRIVWRCTELFALPEKHYQDWLLDQAISIETALQKYRPYISNEIALIVKDTVETIINELVPQIATHSQEKYTEIQNILSQHNSADIVILTRHIAAKNALQQRLGDLAAKVSVFTYNQIGTADRAYKIAIMTAWPGPSLFSDLLQSGLSEKTSALLYSSEKNAMEKYFRRREEIDKFLTLPPEKKCAITTLSSPSFTPLNKGVSSPQQQVPQPDLAEIKLVIGETIFDTDWSARPSVAVDSDLNEGAVKARYISLNDDMCIYLPEKSRIAVITASQHEYRRKTESEIAVGDILIFRGGSEQEMLRNIAQKRYGEGYEQLYNLTKEWRQWLRTISDDPYKIWQILTQAGLLRNYHTVANWFFNEDLIGPQNPNDILAIAKITNEDKNVDRANAVASAVKTIRSLHVEAGFILTRILMARLTQKVISDTAEHDDAYKITEGVRLFTVEEVDSEYQTVSLQYISTPKAVWELQHAMRARNSEEIHHG